MTEDTQVSLFGYEGNPEIIDKGEKDFHKILYTLHNDVDPALTFITYRFNRVGIQHETIDSVCFADSDGIPTLGINYEKFGKHTPLAQMGIVEHNIGHFMSGHVGNRLGLDMRAYCEDTYGKVMGRRLYYAVIEAAADSYVSYPEQLVNEGIPYYDVKKIGLARWAHTLEILKRIEELMDDYRGGDPEVDLEEALNHVINSLLGDSGQVDGNANDPAAAENGGTPAKDFVLNNSRTDNSIVENKLRQMIKEAIERSPDKARGFMSGDAAQFVAAEDVQPVVPWFQQLNHSVSSALSEERRTTRKRLNRRDPTFGFGRVNENITRVVFVVDTSGSMGAEDLRAVNSQLEYIVQNAEEVRVIHCDAGVAKEEMYRRGMSLQEFFGRGGTSFDPALEYIRDNMEMPDAIVYFTDGYGGKLDDENPIIGDWETRLVWVLTPNGLSEERFTESITRQGEVIKVEQWV